MRGSMPSRWVPETVKRLTNSIQIELYEVIRTQRGFGFHRILKRKLYQDKESGRPLVHHDGIYKFLKSEDDMRNLFQEAQLGNLVVWVNSNGVSHYSDDPEVNVSGIRFLPYVVTSG